ncbi:MAG: hypothetical protein Q4E16_01580 [Neisseria sp.]|nr:hypothetical protein [Neisseria sp.]
MKKTSFAFLAVAATLALTGCYTTRDADKYPTVTEVSAAVEGSSYYNPQGGKQPVAHNHQH